ncbi:hypothetical protein [Flavisphingomonas formosensis]|uniref:hypothetical protein n=1 Tax=Flavisphingomonas formosensis TaxID=861534 RepID=UPI0012F7C24A|nr:hypothetical protein [Sphingomonas formosensis]
MAKDILPRTIGLVSIAFGVSMFPKVAHARTQVTPYIEVQQVLDAQLSSPSDVLTYTTVAAGVDASATGHRVEGTVSYRYEYRIPWDKDKMSSGDVHSGIARGQYQIIPNTLSFEGGALATRTRTDIRGAAPLILTGDKDNINQVFGFYGGPTLSTHAGPLQIGASYQLGYVKVEDKNSVLLPTGSQRLDQFDDSTVQNVQASIGMQSGRLPFGWTISGGWQHEDASQLDQRYDGKYVRADVTVPVTAHIALTGGVGYEKINIAERPVLRDTAGNPVTTGNGRYVTDKSAPRLTYYDTDGLIWDVGVIWRPSPRATLQARVGKRYGQTAYTGSLDYRVSENSGLQIGVYNGIESFGRQLIGDVAALPTNFQVTRNPFGGDVNGCVFGATPGSGGCLEDALQSVSTENFRARGVNALFSSRRGPWTMGVGIGYAERRYIAPVYGSIFTVNGVTDRSVTGEFTLTRELTRSSGITGALYAAWYNPGIVNSSDVFAYGGTSTYYHTFGERLSAQASLGIYAYDQKQADDVVSGAAQVGMRYSF